MLEYISALIVFSFIVLIARRRKRKKLFEMAYSLTLNGHTVNAIKIYDRLIKSYPKNFIYYNNRGRCYMFLNDLSKAKADLEKSISLEPDMIVNHIAYENIDRIMESTK